MLIEKTPIDGLFVLTPKVFDDNRGYFLETFHTEKYKQVGINTVFVQDNESRSARGVVRGLHYQIGEAAQAKLLRVVEGVIWDVAVDIRPGSPTFGQWFGVELSAENKKQFFVPRGFAHGFSVLSETATLCYKCDNYYNPKAERGILYDDTDLNVDWKISESERILSEKDLTNVPFRKAEIG